MQLKTHQGECNCDPTCDSGCEFCCEDEVNPSLNSPMTDYAKSGTAITWPNHVSAEDVWKTIHHLEEKMAEGMPIERTIFLLKNTLACYDRTNPTEVVTFTPD